MVTKLMADPISIVLWNVQWASSKTPKGDYFKRRFSELTPGILCMTEGKSEILPNDGHTISSSEDYGYPIKPGRRKVLLWSREPWDLVDNLGSSKLPSGRFVSGVTSTPFGQIRVIGICIPWRDAHIKTGRKDRKPWEDHLAFLRELKNVLRVCSDSIPIVVLGDFNQTIPRSRQPKHIFDAMTDTFGSNYRMVTSGSIPEAHSLSIDHLAVKGCLAPQKIQYLDPHPEGVRMSDHFGLYIQLVSRL